VCGDLTDVAQCWGVVTRAHERFGRLDVLVNSAGGTVRGPALAVSEADWDAVQELNLKSVFFTCQAAARVMAAQPGGGAIVNVASLNSAVGNAWAPQIRQMRDVLTQYAAAGRTVILSSHMLAEVERATGWSTRRFSPPPLSSAAWPRPSCGAASAPS